jgi:hypothetical protein
MVSDTGVVSPGTRFAAIISQAHIGDRLRLMSLGSPSERE